MDEVKEIANVTAVDKDGNDITKDIVGWPEKFQQSMVKLFIS